MFALVRCLPDGNERAKEIAMNCEVTMKEHDREMLKTLCAKVSAERDYVRFKKLLIELNALLEEKMPITRQGKNEG